jgi:hypothetical protein
MSRTITILGLVQLLLVILGFFGLGIVLKAAGYHSEHPEEYGTRWNPIAVMLRQHGLVLLLVPVVWTTMAAVSQNRRRFIFTLDVWAILGVVFSVTIIGLFLYACVYPYTRPMFFGR